MLSEQRIVAITKIVKAPYSYTVGDALDALTELVAEHVELLEDIANLKDRLRGSELLADDAIARFTVLEAKQYPPEVERAFATIYEDWQAQHDVTDEAWEDMQEAMDDGSNGNVGRDTIVNLATFALRLLLSKEAKDVTTLS